MDRYLTHPGEQLMDDHDDMFSSGDSLGPQNATMPNGQGAGGTGAGGTGNGGSGTGAVADINKILTSIKEAPITPECRARANAIITGLIAGKTPAADDAVWIQKLAMASQGLDEFPPECIAGTPWWVWAAGGAGVLLIGGIAYYAGSRKKRGRRK